MSFHLSYSAVELQPIGKVWNIYDVDHYCGLGGKGVIHVCFLKKIPF